jgi:hypothetical protein
MAPPQLSCHISLNTHLFHLIVGSFELFIMPEMLHASKIEIDCYFNSLEKSISKHLVEWAIAVHGMYIVPLGLIGYYVK